MDGSGERRRRVFAELRSWLGTQVLPPPFLARHLALVDRAEAQVVPGACFLGVDVPLAMGTALGLRGGAVEALASVGLLVWAGADLLDDLADAPETVPGHPARQGLVAVNALANLPQVRLAEGPWGPAIASACGVRLARGLMAMSAGQDADLAGASEGPVDPSGWEEAARGKSGEEAALHAGLAARVAALPPDRVDAWEDWGRALGVHVHGAAPQPDHDVIGVKQRDAVQPRFGATPRPRRAEHVAKGLIAADEVDLQRAVQARAQHRLNVAQGPPCQPLQRRPARVGDVVQVDAEAQARGGGGGRQQQRRAEQRRAEQHQRQRPRQAPPEPTDRGGKRSASC